MAKLSRVFGRVRYAVACAVAVVCSLALVAPASANPKYAGLVVDVISGKTLYQDNADAKRYPASLTKIMTLYIVFEELKARRLSLDTKLTVSKYAAARPPSKIGFKPGGTIKVRDAIKALVTKSANDVATTIAENISGSEAKFAQRMTKTARRLGMKSTTFRNASGLPNAQQTTTARDMARLGVAVQRDFPHYYGVFETRVFHYRKRGYRNHNKLLGRVEGVDGIKTGYIRASGFNLVTSVRRDGKHIVAVVMGGRTGASRNAHMKNLIGRTIGKAKRGEAMPVFAWNDRGPAPVPLRKPADALLVARLKRNAEPQPTTGDADPIAGLLAFASETRAAASGDGPAVAAVVAQAAPPSVVPAPAPAISRDSVLALASTPAPTPAEAAVTMAAFNPTDAVAPSAQPELGRTRGVTLPAASDMGVGGAPQTDGPQRFAAAFASVTETKRKSGMQQLADAMRQLTADSRTNVRIGAPRELSAPGPGGPGNDVRQRQAGQRQPAHEANAGWQIQVGAVPELTDVAALHAEAETMAPSLKARTRVTSEVRTEQGAMFRARYAGFETKRQADEACKRFANHNRPCWAVSM